MHWSKSRHYTHESCPRRFLYEFVLSESDDNLAALNDKSDKPPLVRQEAVRDAAAYLTLQVPAHGDSLDGALAKARQMLSERIQDEYTVNTEHSIVEACITTFASEVLDNISPDQLVFVYDGQPVEFMYGQTSIYVLPELVLDKGDHVEIFYWKTGTSTNFRSEREHYLKTGGLTCWARRALRELSRPVVVSETYLRLGGPLTKYQLQLDDDDLRMFAREAALAAKRYGRSARLADFAARPSQKTCRFCPFKTVCDGYAAFTGLAPLPINSAAVEDVIEEPLEPSRRSVFLSHAGEDKTAIVLPFARALECEGISYWLDSAEVTWGDSIGKSIDQGLAISDYVVCFLSDHYLQKQWTEAEFRAAFAKQMSDGQKRVLPIAVTDIQAITAFHSLLADVRIEQWDSGIDSLLRTLKKVLSVRRHPGEDLIGH